MSKYHTFNYAFISDEQVLSAVANGERGHQLLGPIERTRPAVECPEVARIFQHNRDNPSLCDVTGHVQEWMDSAHVFAEDQNIEDSFYRRQSDTSSVPAVGIVRFGYRVHEEGRAALKVHTPGPSTAIGAGMLNQEAVEAIAKLPGTTAAAAFTRAHAQEPKKEQEAVDLISALAAFLKEPNRANKMALDEVMTGLMKTSIQR